MSKKILYLFLFFIAFYYLTALAKDLSDIAQGKQTFQIFRDAQVQILRLLHSLVFCTTSLAGYLIFTKWYEVRGAFKTISAFVLSLFAIISVKYFLEQIICPYFCGFRNYPKNVSFAYYYLDSFSYSFYYSVWGLAFFFFDFVKRKELEKKEIQLQNRIAELSFLRAQVNPHFLFNSINNIYSLVATKPQSALPVLAQLSSLMRYMLYENETEVPLKKELKYLIDYLELQKIRYENPDIVIMDLILESIDLTIAPLLLLPFIENIFKHADLSTNSDKAVITIKTQQTKLMLNTVNKIYSVSKTKSTGIGLENISRRLQLLYPDAHSLIIQENNGYYSVSLVLNLKAYVK